MDKSPSPPSSQDHDEDAPATSAFRTLATIITSRSSRAASIYLAATVVNLAVPFLLLPVLTRYLQPGSYGRTAVLQTIFSVAGAVTLFGTTGPLLRSFTVGDPAARRDYLASCLAITGLLGAATLLASVVFSKPLSALMEMPRLWLTLAVFAGLCNTILQLQLTVLRAEHKSASYGVLMNGQTAINIGVSLALVVGLGLGWQGRAVGIIVSSFVLAAWSLLNFRRSELIGSIRKAYVRNALELGGAASIHTVLGVFLTTGDRLVLSTLYTPSTVGLYAVGAQLAAGYAVLGSAINLAWSPWLFRKLAAIRNRSDHAQLLRLMIIASIAIIVAAVVYGVVLSVAFHWVVGDRYAASTTYFPALLGASCLQNLYFVFVGALFYYHKPKILAASGAIVFVTALIVVFPLSHLLGPVGVAFTVLGLRFMMFAAAAGAALFLMRRAVIRAVAAARERDAGDMAAI